MDGKTERRERELRDSCTQGVERENEGDGRGGSRLVYVLSSILLSGRLTAVARSKSRAVCHTSNQFSELRQRDEATRVTFSQTVEGLKG